ncbi:MAG: hypothetical protein WD381_04595 [Balneolaceae bacterium]
MTQKFLLFFCFVLLTGCTTSKWTVVDEYAVNESEQPRLISEKEQLMVDEEPTIENPTLSLAPYRIIENEYSQRILVERAVQQYRPRWGFALLALSGSAFAITAANSDLILANQTSTQRIGLSAAGVLLGALAFTNLKEVGDPILTDEQQYLRSTGTTTRIDTVRSTSEVEETAAVEITYKGNQIFDDSTVSFSDGAIDLNLGSFAIELNGELDEDGEINVSTRYKESDNEFSIPIKSFLEPYFIVQESVVQVRSTPSFSSENIMVELGEDSELLKLGDESSDWVNVEYAGQEAFVARESGVLEWRSRSDGESAVLVELEDLPFGEIDVENSLPILKSTSENDRAIIFSNAEGNQIGNRQLLSRSHQLFEHYMSTSFRMNDDQIIKITEPHQSSWEEQMGQCGNTEGGNLNVFLTGFAEVKQSGEESELVMIYEDTNGDESELSISSLFNTLGECGADQVFIFADLEYIKSENELLDQVMIDAENVQEKVSNRFVDSFPNSVVIFGNSTKQQSSTHRGGSLENDKRHYIFPYYLAEAFKQRKTVMSDLIEHLENNVDYTSRRLHDRPQEIRAFGNFSLNIAE